MSIFTDDVDLSRKDRVPRFWSDDQGNDFLTADGIVLLVGVCFGAIASPGFSHFRRIRSC